jgi:hypothetical protein
MLRLMSEVVSCHDFAMQAEPTTMVRRVYGTIFFFPEVPSVVGRHVRCQR